ncbi:uncharacterized protein K460DRAFT_394984 [Cucurbitaria berberidis CBS 394.84]|uniref:3-hydroxyisobutyrate dehydrogenase n=1 Tax=Cucurbitaria berberidis CBS 394.84 TaxID=1168544 RepID=A0A9P4GGQ0_9PLEO|nr:uncharacterized protein K460DRAFT_394984 [Cucurbitaria berberidis CBS 394.84]KAF1845297.1 hypothetical protein K460DRAFT_394984 [Cucurbitaria berberidis CBS 394.84]
MAERQHRIAFIGLGAMGFGMATNLTRRGYNVTGFDAWGPTRERFLAEGGRIVDSPAEAVKDKDFVISCVATNQQTQAVFFDGEGCAAPALSRGATLLIASTVSSSYIQSFASQLTDAGRHDIFLVDCPISGGAQRAADGTLSIMASGADAAVEKATFLMSEMAAKKKLYIVKGSIGAGSNMKMVHQVLAAIHILAASEAMGFAFHLGLDPVKTREAILGSRGSSFMFDHRTPRMFTNFRPVASALTIILKDANIITSEARRNDFPTPMSSIAEQVFLDAFGRGFGADDDSGLVRLYTGGVYPTSKNPAIDTSIKSQEERLAMVIALLEGIHLCAAAEALAFAAQLGLDLAQVYELCSDAAGGSRLLDLVGRGMLQTLSVGDTVEQGGSLRTLANDLRAAVEEAGRVKAPVFLGSQANNMVSITARHQSLHNGDSLGKVIRLWYPNAKHERP